MVKIPKREESPYALNHMINISLAPRERRSRRLGMASVADECARKVWFKFRWARVGDITMRIKRIFDTGNVLEEQVISSLEALGIEVTDKQKAVEGWGGHIFGYIDGIAHNVPEAPKTPHLLEVKSMNDKHFTAFKKYGLEETKREHLIQMTNYMGKLELTRGLYAAINKNTSEIWTERVYFDKALYKEFMGRAIDIVSHETPPPNLMNDSNKYICRFCDFNPICYGNEPLLKSCRTCTQVDIEDKGQWSCRRLNKQLTFEEQEKGCDYYSPIQS